MVLQLKYIRKWLLKIAENLGMDDYVGANNILMKHQMQLLVLMQIL